MSYLPPRPRVGDIHPLVGKSERWLRLQLAQEPGLAARLGRATNGTFEREKVLSWVEEQLATPDLRTANLGQHAQPGPRAVSNDERLTLADAAELAGMKPRTFVRRYCDTAAKRKVIGARKAREGWSFDRIKMLLHIRDRACAAT